MENETPYHTTDYGHYTWNSNNSSRRISEAPCATGYDQHTWGSRVNEALYAADYDQYTSNSSNEVPYYSRSYDQYTNSSRMHEAPYATSYDQRTWNSRVHEPCYYSVGHDQYTSSSRVHEEPYHAAGHDQYTESWDNTCGGMKEASYHVTVSHHYRKSSSRNVTTVLITPQILQNVPRPATAAAGARRGKHLIAPQVLNNAAGAG